MIQLTDDMKLNSLWTMIDTIIDNHASLDPVTFFFFSFSFFFFKKKKNSHLQDLSITKQLFNDFLWKFQLIQFEYVIYGLVRGNREDENGVGFQILEDLFKENGEFHSRFKCWISLNVNPNFWLEEKYIFKLKDYYNNYPEYYNFEACGRFNDPEPLPIYFNNLVLIFFFFFK